MQRQVKKNGSEEAEMGLEGELSDLVLMRIYNSRRMGQAICS